MPLHLTDGATRHVYCSSASASASMAAGQAKPGVSLTAARLAQGPHEALLTGRVLGEMTETQTTR